MYIFIALINWADNPGGIQKKTNQFVHANEEVTAEAQRNQNSKVKIQKVSAFEF